MSVAHDHGPDPRADPLVAAALRVAREQAPVDCPEAELLGLFAERSLTGSELATVTAHVAGCARCQATVALFVQGDPALAVAPEPSIVSAVPWWAGWRWMVPLASATAVLAVAVWIGRGPTDQVAQDAGARSDAAAMETPGTAPFNAPATAPATAAARVAPQEAKVASPAGDARARAPEAPSAFAGAAGGAGAPAPTDRTSVADAAVAPSAAAPRRAEAPAVPAPTAEASAQAPPTIVGQASAMNALKESVPSGTLAGTVRARTGAALPGGAVVEVRLLDVSRADAPATTLARAESALNGPSVAVPFALRYDPAALDPRHRYVVQATVAVDGRIIWRTTTQHPVLSGGTPAATTVTVLVDPLR